MSDCKHCWHPAPYTHATDPGPGRIHIDETCCHCGAARCQTVELPKAGRAWDLEGHGPYHPARGIRVVLGAPVMVPAPQATTWPRPEPLTT